MVDLYELVSWLEKRPQAGIDLAAIATAGKVAVIVYKPPAGNAEDLRALGWDGQADVFALDDGQREEVAKRRAEAGDDVTAAWLMREPPGARLYLFAGGGCMLLNNNQGELKYEPNSTAIPTLG